MGMDDARMGHEEELVVGSVVVLDGSTVREFATDEKAFTSAIDKMFASLDSNGDGVLSRTEIRPAFERLNLEEMQFGVPVTKTTDEVNALYDSVFDTFDTDHNNKVDLLEFRSQLKEILLAIADGLGFAPLTMMVSTGACCRMRWSMKQTHVTSFGPSPIDIAQPEPLVIDSAPPKPS
jgi:hypothetical protein